MQSVTLAIAETTVTLAFSTQMSIIERYLFLSIVKNEA